MHAGEFDGRRDGFCHGIWDVVEFQIEENLGASVRELFDRSRTLGCEELATYLEKPDCPVKFSD